LAGWREWAFIGVTFMSLIKIFLSVCLVSSLVSCDLVRQIENRAEVVNHYEDVSLALAKENRDLRAKIAELEYEIESQKAKTSFLEIKLSKFERGSDTGRGIASVKKASAADYLDNVTQDYVGYQTYKWTPQQILSVAETEFDKKNYEKSAQFFRTFLYHFPTHELVDDQLLFQAGVAAYESKRHYNWAKEGLGRIIVEYPASKFYRGAKLWFALSHLQTGDKGTFFKIVEEFRNKYRNTQEWKILRSHYEEIVKRYK